MRNLGAGLIAGVFCVAIQVPLAQAGLIGLDPIESGEIFRETDGLVIPPFNTTKDYFHRDGLDELTAMYYDSIGCLCYQEEGTSGYAIYDLTGMGEVVESVSMRLDVTLSGSPQDDLLHVLSMVAIDVQALSLLPAGPLTPALGESLFFGVGSGPSLGFTQMTQGQGIYTIDLGAEAVSMINSATGALAFGFRDPGTSGYEAALTFNQAPQLQLFTAVPVPGTLWMSLGGLVILMRWTRASDR